VQVVIVISGAHKAHALQKCVEEGLNHMWTVSMVQVRRDKQKFTNSGLRPSLLICIFLPCLQLHPRACIVCDEDATLDLKVRTVKYFKSLLDVHNKMLGTA